MACSACWDRSSSAASAACAAVAVQTSSSSARIASTRPASSSPLGPFRRGRQGSAATPPPPSRPRSRQSTDGRRRRRTVESNICSIHGPCTLLATERHGLWTRPVRDRWPTRTPRVTTCRTSPRSTCSWGCRAAARPPWPSRSRPSERRCGSARMSGCCPSSAPPTPMVCATCSKAGCCGWPTAHCGVGSMWSSTSGCGGATNAPRWPTWPGTRARGARCCTAGGRGRTPGADRRPLVGVAGTTFAMDEDDTRATSPSSSHRTRTSWPAGMPPTLPHPTRAGVAWPPPRSRWGRRCRRGMACTRVDSRGPRSSRYTSQWAA